MELIHTPLVVCLNCRNVPYNWNGIVSEFITLPSQKPSLAGMAGHSLLSCFTLVHKRLHILHYPGSRSEDKLWWRDLLPAILEQRMICLRYNSFPSLTFPSVKGWLEPGLLQLCSRCHRWASFFLLLDLGATDSAKKRSRSTFLHIWREMGIITPMSSQYLASHKEKWFARDWIFSLQSQFHPFAVLTWNKLTAEIWPSITQVSAQH